MYISFCFKCVATEQSFLSGVLLLLFILFIVLLHPASSFIAPFSLVKLVLFFNMIYFQQFIKSVWLKAWRGMKRWCTALAHSAFQWMKLRAWWIKSDLKEFAQWVVSVITAMSNTYWSLITLSHSELTSTHTRQVDFPLQPVWLEALAPGRSYLFPGTAALSTGCQASSGKTPKKLGPPMHLFTVYRNVSAVISWRPSLEIQLDTAMEAMWRSVAKRAGSNWIYLKQLFSWLFDSTVAWNPPRWLHRSCRVSIY